MTTDEITARWRAGETLQQIADAAGISKQAVSKRLLRAGYSPRERMYAARAAEGNGSSAATLDRLTERAEARAAAAARLAALAAEHGMSPRSLAAMAPSPLAEEARRVCAPFSVDYLAHVTPG